MMTILPGIFTWPWFSARHGYDFNGYLVVHSDGNVAVDPVEMPPEVLDEIVALGVGRIVLTNRSHVRASAKLREATGPAWYRHREMFFTPAIGAAERRQQPSYISKCPRGAVSIYEDSLETWEGERSSDFVEADESNALSPRGIAASGPAKSADALITRELGGEMKRSPGGEDRFRA